MTQGKKIGIWMDHSNANLMEFTTDQMQTQTLESKFTHDVMEQSLSKGEHLMHNKSQHQLADYYKQLGEVIKGYEGVVLFGPTDAKTELHNILKADHHFDKIKIEVKPTDKMTEHQQHAFVKEYFSGH